ncbi:MAG: patatin-like phospholipase family protein [Candidatus Obscuribacterales bacterium]|nr:patatin-like phospholipase family protein [Candidatus Obscuribacterales bacterium]
MPPEKRDSTVVRPSRALVLSGGGGRGAYEVGVMKAYSERNFAFDWIIGTSIGAINATLFAQGDLAVLEEVWSKITSQHVYKLPSPQHLRRVFFGQRLGFLDTSPLEEMLNRYVDIERFRASPSQIGIVTTDLCSLETKVFFKHDIETKEQLVDILMASSAVPLLFPPRQLNGEGCWMDGGLATNTPIQEAINLGAREVYAVLVEPDPVDECPASLPKLIARIIEMLLDQSARSGITHVSFFNRRHRLNELAREVEESWCRLEGPGNNGSNSNSDASAESEAAFLDQIRSNLENLERVRLFLVKPPARRVGSLLEIDPISSKWLLRMGYEDAIKSCVHIES